MVFHLCSLGGRVVLSPEPMGAPLYTIEASPEMFDGEVYRSAWEFGSKPLRCFPACVPWAGGTGETIAMTAMRCGKTAQEAVELACEMDIYTSGPLQTVTVN